MYSADLRLSTPNYSFTLRVLAIIIPVLTVAVVAATATYMGLGLTGSKEAYEQTKEAAKKIPHNDPDGKKEQLKEEAENIGLWAFIIWPMIMSLTSPLLLVLIIGSLYASVLFWKKPPVIFINQSNVLLRLSDLIKKLQQLDISQLPTSKETLESMSSQVRNLRDAHKLSDIQAGFTSIIQTLRILQTDFNQSNKKAPLLLEPDVYIDIPEEESESESTSLYSI